MPSLFVFSLVMLPPKVTFPGIDMYAYDLGHPPLAALGLLNSLNISFSKS